MVVILQSNLFCLHVEFLFSLLFLYAFPHLRFYCSVFNAPIGQASPPVRPSAHGRLSDMCVTGNNPNSTEDAGALS